MKFGELIGYNMRILFLEKSYTEYIEETIPDPFLKNKNWAYISGSKVLHSLFLLHAKLRAIEIFRK